MCYSLKKKKKKNTANYTSTANQINSYWRSFFKKKKIEVLVIPVATEKLLYLTTSHSKGKFMYPYVPWSEMRYVVCTPDLYNLKTRKKLEIYVIVRI